MKYKYLFFAISLLFLLPSVYFLSRYGLKPSLDFTGGTLLEISIDPNENASVSTNILEKLIQPLADINSIQETGDNSYIIRAQEFDSQTNQEIQANIRNNLGEPTEIRFETIGPTLGKELIKKTIIGILLASSFILLYVATRFKNYMYGICAILAMLHDTFILLGVFSFLGFYASVEIDALFVTALLTILSFSVHDTIVVYDRIRESIKLYPKMDFTSIVNQAVTETLGRSVNNSLTIIFMLASLYLLGGQTTKWFVFALLIGTISGTYSSTFTAAPLLVLWQEIKSKRKKS